MCIFIRGFRVSAGLVLVMDFHPNWFRVRVSVLGARRLHPIRTRPVAILTASLSLNASFLTNLAHSLLPRKVVSVADQNLMSLLSETPIPHAQNISTFYSTSAACSRI